MSMNLIRNIVTKKVSYYMSLSLSFSESGTEDKDLGAVIYFGGGPMKK